MKRLSFCLAFLMAMLAASAFGQDYRGEWQQLFDKKDLAGQEKLLKRWEAAKPEDAELFVAYFNYHVSKGRTETLTLGTHKPNGQSVEMTKTDDPKVRAYIASDVSYARDEIDAAMTYIDRGIAKYPDRLDMRFGKIFMLGQIRDFDRLTNEAVKTIERSAINKNNWTWTSGTPKQDGQKSMLSGIQDYVVQLNDSLDDSSAQIRRIAEAALKIYPDNVENLSNLAVSYLLKKDFDAALAPLLKAEKIAPMDLVILGNIAYSYFNKHDKPNAVKYYELLRSNGDDEAKHDADSKLKEIKKW
jgi:tetratricopeptide (TPR) repeat protein